MIRLIDHALIREVAAQAKASPRQRMHRNFHPRDNSPGHRLLIAIEPGSYVMPHRHLDPNKDESIVCLKGRLGMVFFDSQGSVVQTVLLTAGGETLGVDIPHGVFHTLLALEADSAFFEAKGGPYLPLSEAEKAPWAPAEGDAGAAGYQASLEKLFS